MLSIGEEIAKRVLELKNTNNTADFDPSLDWIRFLSLSHVKHLRKIAQNQDKELDLKEKWEDYFPSTKIKKCVEILEMIRRERPGEKTIGEFVLFMIAFNAFQSFLNSRHS